MSIIRRLFNKKAREIAIRSSIAETKEAILRLEILTTELDAKEEESRSHEKLLKIAVDDLDTALWGKNLAGVFTFLNEACAEKILGTTVSDAMAMTDSDFEHDALAQVCMKTDVIVLETQKTHRFIEHARYADGNDLWLDSTKSPWIVENSMIGSVGFGQNITGLVPEDVREKYKDSGFIEIPVDLLYGPKDISGMIENV